MSEDLFRPFVVRAMPLPKDAVFRSAGGRWKVAHRGRSSSAPFLNGGYRFAAGERIAPRLLQKKMRAVLPFENMSGQKSQEYFVDRLTEEMITQLGRMIPERLGLMARSIDRVGCRTSQDSVIL